MTRWNKSSKFGQQYSNRDLQSRGPGTNPFRASGPEMGTKMAEKWILASPGKWGKHGPENRKNGPNMAPRDGFVQGPRKSNHDELLKFGRIL